MRNLNQMLVALGSRQVVVAILLAIVIAAVAFGLSADLASAGGRGGVTTQGGLVCFKC
jgi:hypothetical protein